MNHWWRESIFYAIYPLGATGAPLENDLTARRTPPAAANGGDAANPGAPADRMARIADRLPDITALGCNALNLGPVFESSKHGYDTVSYRRIDRRLGNERSFVEFVDRCHAAGVRVVLDGVLNHVGRDFEQFRDVRERGAESEFVGWFSGIDFGSDSPFGDGFAYQGWEGHHDLVTLNHEHPGLRAHVLESIQWMIRSLDIDGLRLDVAYLLNPAFVRELAATCRAIKPDFWLMGEMIHGDYRTLVGPDMLDSATNYECYKGLYSSFNDANLHEIAWSFRRQFGPEGIYRSIRLYNFADNHDVDRLASALHDPRHLPLVYTLLFTMPGIPSVYYGSEWGVAGRRTEHSDRELRPAFSTLPDGRPVPPGGAAPPGEPVIPGATLYRHIQHLAALRREHPALVHGEYEQVHVDHRQLVFRRRMDNGSVVVAVNAAGEPADLSGVAGVSGELRLGPFGWVVRPE